MRCFASRSEFYMCAFAFNKLYMPVFALGYRTCARSSSETIFGSGSEEQLSEKDAKGLCRGGKGSVKVRFPEVLLLRTIDGERRSLADS